MLWELLVFLVVLWLLYRRWKMRRQFELGNKLKTSLKSYPVIGHSLMFIGTDKHRMRTFEVFGREAIKTGGITSIWQPNQLFICVADPASAEVIMNQCLEKHEVAYVVRFLIGGGSLYAPNRMSAFETFGREAFKTGGLSPLWWNDLLLMVSDPELCDVLLSQCLSKMDMVKVIFSFVIGGGSLFAPVPIWRARRKIVLPMFSSKNFNKFTEVFAERSINMIDLMEKEVGRETFSFWDYIVNCTLDSVCENTLGVNIKHLAIDIGKLKTVIEELFSLAASRVCKPWFHTDFMFKFMPEYAIGVKHKIAIRSFVAKILKDKRKLIKKNETAWAPDKTNNEKAPSFFDQLIKLSEDDQKLTDLELLEEAIVLVVAGLDSSATGVGFTALMLGRHPEVQERVYEELQEVFGDSDRPVTTTDLLQLKYLEAVIKETLRLFPPFPIIARQLDNDVTLPSGLTILKGTGLLVNFWAVHRHPGYWGSDAEQFRPERFFDALPSHPAAFIPFSYGQRNCIGYQYAMLSMKTALATMLRRYRVLSPPGVTKDDPVRNSFDIILRNVDKFQIRIEYRR